MVELVSPFPAYAIPRVWGWIEQFRDRVADDFSPRTLEAFVEHWEAALYAQSGHSVTLAWTDTLNPAGTTYNAWRASGMCPATAPTTTPPAGFTQLNSSPITATTYADTAVTAGDTYCYVVTAVGPNGSSVPSSTAGATVPAAFPVSGLTVTVR